MFRRLANSSALVLGLIPALLFFAGHGRPASAQPAAPQSAPAVAAPGPWQQDLAAWRAHRQAEISAPDGWLTLAGLDWLKPGVNSIGSAADNQIHLPASAPEHLGLITIVGGQSPDPHSAKANSASAAKPAIQPAIAPVIQLLAPAAGFPAGLLVDGKPAREGPLVAGDSNGSTIVWHGMTMVVLKRGDRFVLRVKDADSPVRTSFRGLNWYPADPKYRITARWIPFKPPLMEEISTVIGTTLKLPAPGLAMFLIDGKVQHLEPVLEDPQGKTLFFILRDPTSKTTTYGGGRFLHASFPDRGLDQPGNLVLDFNRLENPPCAYTSFATCPLPPKQNQLDVAVEAGEQRYER